MKVSESFFVVFFFIEFVEAIVKIFIFWRHGEKANFGRQNIYLYVFARALMSLLKKQKKTSMS